MIEAMKRPSRLLYVMNIPSPYRWHLFTRLHQIGASKGIEFHVAFLTSQSRGRRWHLNDFPNSFDFTVPWGVNLSRNTDRLLNPGLIFHLLYESWDWIILGGYDNPTTALLTLLPLVNTRVKLIRNEGNLQAHSRFTHGPVARAKQLFLQRCDGYFVPGQRGREWLDHWLPERGAKPVHVFPNVIDDRRLIAQVTELRKNRADLRQKLGVDEETRLLITPARLIPEKGLLELIRNLPADFGQKNVWLIAGEGPMQADIVSLLADTQLQGSVKLLGYVHPDQMPELYAIADIFLLPSLSDPNPLSAIEAAFAGLPLLVSRRIGNAPELLADHVTGWGFEPTNPDEVRQAVHQAITASDAQLTMMSEAVARRAEDFYASDAVCERLIDFLLQIYPHDYQGQTQVVTQQDTV